MNKLGIVLAIGLVAGGAAGYFFGQSRSDQGGMSPVEEGSTEEPLFYRNPMNPAITSPVPAKDEMGMDYVPVYADSGGGPDEKPGTVTIDPVTVQNIGVRTAPVMDQTLAREIPAVGRVAYDEEGISRLHPKIDGWIEDLFVDETGVLVEDDTILLSVYSPKLVSTQQEFLLALNNRDVLAESPFDDVRQGAESLVESSLARLKLLDVPQHQIDDLERSREIQKSLHVHSPFRGIVVNIGVREGQYVTPQTELYMIADLSTVWVFADIYEDDLPWVRVGDPATVDIVGIPGEQYEGKVTYIYPYLESKSRTIRVRLEFENPEFRLKPDMYANVRIAASRQIDAIVVPSEAIVRSGLRAIVFVALGEGKFEPREVTLGVSANGKTQILKGLAEGETVVTSSQFLIDSESKLREATAKMLEPKGAAGEDKTDSSQGMSHQGMSHDGMSHDEMSKNKMSGDDSSSEDMSREDHENHDMRESGR